MPADPTGADARTLAEVVREHVENTLARHDGHKRETAAALGINLKTLYNMLNRWKETERTAHA